MIQDLVLVGAVAYLCARMAAYIIARYRSKVPRTCGSCHYYDNGACRRYPPARAYDPPTDATVWPVVRLEQDWCGEYIRYRSGGGR